MGLVKRVQAFWAKFSNDWCMNLSGLLAYNFLTAIFPLLLGILALGALVLPDAVIHPMADKLNSLLPMGAAAGSPGNLNIDFYTVLQGFKRASGLTALVSLLWTGSNLFGVMAQCYGRCGQGQSGSLQRSSPPINSCERHRKRAEKGGCRHFIIGRQHRPRVASGRRDGEMGRSAFVTARFGTS